MELKGSKTEANLWTAFAGESQARNKYTYFASARPRRQAMSRSPLFLRRLPAMRRSTPRCGSRSWAALATPLPTCSAAAEGENGEWTQHVSRDGRYRPRGGLRPVWLILFEAVAAIEKEHEERYLKLLANLEERCRIQDR